MRQGGREELHSFNNVPSEAEEGDACNAALPSAIFFLGGCVVFFFSPLDVLLSRSHPPVQSTPSRTLLLVASTRTPALFFTHRRPETSSLSAACACFVGLSLSVSEEAPQSDSPLERRQRIRGERKEPACHPDRHCSTAVHCRSPQCLSCFFA